MGDCLIGLIYLIVSGRIVKIACLSTTTKWWPVHYVGVTKRGHVLHFNSVLEHKYNHFAPFWYEGRFEGINKSKIDSALKESGRYIICYIDKLWAFALFGSIVVGLFVIPVWLYMCFYPMIVFLNDVCKAVKTLLS